MFPFFVLYNCVPVADPQSLVEEKETVEEKLAISQYELRLAQEDLLRLKAELQKRDEYPPDKSSGWYFLFYQKSHINMRLIFSLS